MSTRCQVKVTGTDINNADSFTMYHHCDGYPSYMLPIIASGWQDTWQAGRIGKAAAMVVGADIRGFELEQGHEIHGDIEYYYVVDVTNGAWAITVYESPYDSTGIASMDKLGVYSVSQAIAYKE